MFPAPCIFRRFPTLDHDVVSSIASQMQDVTSAIQALHSMYPKEVEAALQQRQQLYNDEQLARRLTGEKSITELLVGWGWGDRPDSVTSSYVAAEEQPRHFIQVTSSGAIKPSTAGLEAKATEERTKPPSFIATETDDITAVARGLAAQVGGNYQGTSSRLLSLPLFLLLLRALNGLALLPPLPFFSTPPTTSFLVFACQSFIITCACPIATLSPKFIGAVALYSSAIPSFTAAAGGSFRYQRSIATSKAKREHGAIHHYIQKLKELRAVCRPP